MQRLKRRFRIAVLAASAGVGGCDCGADLSSHSELACFEQVGTELDRCIDLCKTIGKDCYDEHCEGDGAGETMCLHVSADCTDAAPILISDMGPVCWPDDPIEIPDTDEDGQPGPIGSVECCCGVLHQ